MKEWANTLILVSFVGLIAKLILPKSEKSTLYGPIHFLCALIMILAVFSPIMKGMKRDLSLDIVTEDLFTFDMKEKEETLLLTLLERSTAMMTEEVKQIFPDAIFTLQMRANTEFVPEEMLVLCEDAVMGQNIADYIQVKYSIEANLKEKESDNESY